MDRPTIRSIQLSDEMLAKREHMFEQLQSDERIVKFLDRHDLDVAFLKQNIQRFYDWTKQLDLKDQCEDSELCYLSNGYYEDLDYDGLLKKQLVPCKHTLMKLQVNDQLKNFVHYDMPPEHSQNSIATIFSSKDEPAEYKLAISKIVEYLDRLEGFGYYIYGDVGVGKTYIMSAMANAIVEEGKKVAFVHVPTFTNDLKGMMSRRESVDQLLNTLKYVEVLIMDDIGTEGVSDWLRDDILMSILNYRMEANKTCFFTSNLSMDQLEQYYSVNNRKEVRELAAKRLLERIRMTSREVQLVGKNRRIYK